MFHVYGFAEPNHESFGAFLMNPCHESVLFFGLIILVAEAWEETLYIGGVSAAKLESLC